MLVQFERTATHEDEDGIETALPISVNPDYISAVLTGFDGEVIIKLPDGRGYKVRGSFEEVMTKLGTVGTRLIGNQAEEGEVAGLLDAPH